MLDRILVPLDGSSVAECVLPHAETLAASFGSRVVLLRVVPDDAGARAALRGAESRRAKAEAGAYLRRLAGRFTARGLETETIVEEGPPAERIADVARRAGADVVVLCSDRTLPIVVGAGGVARDVISAAPASMLVVRPGAAKGGEGRTYGRIVVPVDGSKRGEWALCMAACVARTQGAELLLLHVLAPPEILEGDEHGTAADLRARVEEHNRSVAARYLERMTEQLEGPNLSVTTRLVEDANVARAIDAVARDEAADLVVMSAHGHSGHLGWSYGSKARRLVDEGRSTTLVLQDNPARRPTVGLRRSAPARARPARRSRL